jgi:nucleotide-binding universal stress UspA family protein
MVRKILVALDGSRVSEGVLPYARFLARALKVPVSLFRVVGPQSQKPMSTVGRELPTDLRAGEAKTCSDYLRRVADTFPPELTVDWCVDTGHPAERIAERAAADAGTLIVMATHGRSGIQRWLLGSIAGKVLQIATNPLFLVRGTREPESGEAPLKRVVVPLDGSEPAELAIPHAVELTRRIDMEIVLARVYLLPGVAYPTGDYAPDWDLLNREVRETATRYLERKMLELQREGVERVSSAVLEGSAAEKIMDLAHEKPWSMIAMCTHGQSGVGRWVLGSITERVVRHSSDPVLIIRAPRRS